MTNKEAIEALERIRDEATNEFIGDWADYEAFNVAIKALKVVTCGECKYYLPMQKNSPPYVRCRCYCNKGAIKATSPDDFCSYGERKNDE